MKEANEKRHSGKIRGKEKTFVRKEDDEGGEPRLQDGKTKFEVIAESGTCDIMVYNKRAGGFGVAIA